MIKVKIFSILSLLICLHGFAQQVHVRYLFVRSPIATLYEDLYIKDSKVISIQDSIINFNTAGTLSAIRKSKSGPIKFNFISNLNEENPKLFFWNYIIDDTKYFIKDEVPKPEWVINENSTKTILGYKCVQAKTSFRGTNFTAYFTKDLPYSAGPFKFFGLPGLILDIREDNSNYNIWKADKIIFEVESKINFNPQFKDMRKVTMKELVKIYDERYDAENKQLSKNLLPGTKMTSDKIRFGGLEKVFEWEK